MAEKSNNSFVDILVEDPAIIPELVVLSGFPGKSSEENCKRLYLNAALSEYYEIPADAILHEHKHPPATSPLGVTTIWIKKDAELSYKGSQGTSSKAKFFSGPIQQNYVAASPAGTTQGCENTACTKCQK